MAVVSITLTFRSLLLLLWFLLPVAFAASLDEEARWESQKFFGAKFVKCGQSHYTWYPNVPPANPEMIEQFKGYTIYVSAEQLTETDRLNGIEWKGSAQLDAQASRSFFLKENEWNQWYDGVPYTHKLSMEKRNSKWIIANDDNIYPTEMWNRMKLPGCTNLPR